MLINRFDYDAIVVGSGFGAAAPALRLAESGLRVLVLEKGPAIDPLRDFKQTQDPKYLMRWFRGLDGPHFGMTFVEGLGGASGFYEMVSLRAPSVAFGQADEGRRLWPEGLDRSALDPWYERAEQMLRVRQIRPEDVPRSGLVFSQMMKDQGYSCERARYAETGCIDSGFCVTGCIYGVKQSPLTTYIPAAKAAGAEYRCDTEVLEIGPVWSEAGRPAAGYELYVRTRGKDSGKSRLRAPIVVLAAGTVGTARLLFASRHRLGRLNPHVGRNICFNGGVKAAAVLGDHLPDGDMFTGRTHAGMISYEFLESRGITISAVKAMPLMASVSFRLREEPTDPLWGAPHVKLMKKYRRRVLGLYAMGLTPAAGAVVQKPGGKLATRLDRTPELEEYYRSTKALLRSIFVGSGCQPLEISYVTREGMPREEHYVGTAHQVGSCRMADRADDGVCDRSGQMFGWPGLYVADGAAVPTSLAVNPSLTILANSERITDGILGRAGARTYASAQPRARTASRSTIRAGN